MSSSDDVVDDTDAMAPCLRTICDNESTSLTSEAIAKFRGWQLTHMDVLGEFITASDFVERGEEVVRACSLWRQLLSRSQRRARETGRVPRRRHGAR